PILGHAGSSEVCAHQGQSRRGQTMDLIVRRMHKAIPKRKVEPADLPVRESTQEMPQVPKNFRADSPVHRPPTRPMAQGCRAETPPDCQARSWNLTRFAAAGFRAPTPSGGKSSEMRTRLREPAPPPVNRHPVDTSPRVRLSIRNWCIPRLVHRG